MTNPDDGGVVGSDVPPVAESVPRRRRARRDLLGLVAAVGIVVFAVLGIGRALIGGEVFDGAELLRAYAPYHDTAIPPVLIDNPCVGDTIDSMMPETAAFRSRLWHGDFALWDSNSVGGTPVGSVPNFAVLSPFSLPSLLLPPWLSPAYVKLLEILGGALGMCLFLRRVGTTRAAGWLGGLLFVSSGFLVMWTNWPQTRTASCIPWLFWAIERLVQRRRWSDAVPLALAVAALLAGGFPAVAGYALYAGVAYLAVRSTVEARRVFDAARRTAVGLACIGLGVLLLAFQLLPFAAQLGELELARGQSPTNHLPFTSIVTAAFPTIYGKCVGATWIGPHNQIEVIAFIGAAALVLAGVALLRGPARGIQRGVRGYFAVGTLVVVVLGWYGGVPLQLAQKFPVFSNNPVLRIRVMFGFFVAVLAAIGFDRLQRQPAPTDRRRWWSEVVGWIVAITGAVLVVRAVDVSFDHELRYTRHVLIGPTAAGVCTLLVAMLLAANRVARRERLRTVLLALVLVIATAESTAFARGFWPRSARRDFYPVTSVHRYLQSQSGQGDRYVALGPVMLAGTNVYYGLASPTGHGFTLPPWMDLLRTVDPKVQLSPTYTSYPAALSAAGISSPIFDRLAVRWILTEPGAALFGETQASAPVSGAPGRITLAANGSATFAVTPGPLRGVVLSFVAAPTDVVGPGKASWLHVDLLDDTGRTITSNRRRLDPGIGTGPFSVALAAQEAGVRARSARVRIEGPAVVTLATTGGAPTASVVRPADDGLRLVFAAGANVWERTTAQPRVRWATNVAVESNHDRRLARLASTREPGTVVLDHAVPAVSGAGARIRASSPDAESRRITVDADGSGYVVVADSFARGWVATVDGHTVPIETADHALGAVRVSAGHHVVVLVYRPVHQRLGFLLAGGAVVVLVGCVVIDRRRRKRRGRTTA